MGEIGDEGHWGSESSEMGGIGDRRIRGLGNSEIGRSERTQFGDEGIRRFRRWEFGRSGSSELELGDRRFGNFEFGDWSSEIGIWSWEIGDRN